MEKLIISVNLLFICLSLLNQIISAGSQGFTSWVRATKDFQKNVPWNRKMSQTPEFYQYISLIERPKQSPHLNPFARLTEEILFLSAKHCTFLEYEMNTAQSVLYCQVIIKYWQNHKKNKAGLTFSHMSCVMPVLSAQCTSWSNLVISRPVLFFWSVGFSSLPKGRPKVLRVSCRYCWSCALPPVTLPSSQRCSRSTKHGAELQKRMFPTAWIAFLKPWGRGIGLTKKVMDKKHRQENHEKKKSGWVDGKRDLSRHPWVGPILTMLRS